MIHKWGAQSMKFTKQIVLIITIIFLIGTLQIAGAWYDQTHVAIAKAAGYDRWFNAAAADTTRLKAEYIEKNNHYYNNYADVPVTDKLVLSQVRLYDSPNDPEGHLYGAIVAAIQKYREGKKFDKEHHLAFASHYIGDLSQPLHNMPYDEFNQTRHSKNDGIVNKGILDNSEKITKNMYEIKLNPAEFDADLAKEIARIANLSRLLGIKIKSENRNMSRDEAYIQLGHSASLLKAVLKVVKPQSIDEEAE